ncbi:acyltransferase, partial [Candidatus Ozemobacteraceae bacterium]|nr:acyltransferase [Candidatus Ozemobacteraceae bacterium]
MIVFYHSLPKNTFRSPESLIETGIFKFLDNFDIGVILFFVISGYCIAASTVSSLKKSVTSKWRVVGAYFLRRLRRIYPPYWMSLVFLVVLYGFASLLLTGGEVSPLKVPSCQQIIGNLTLTETWRPLLFSEPEYLLLGPAWSLCYEEQFYFLMGLMIVAECSLGLWTMGVSA